MSNFGLDVTAGMQRPYDAPDRNRSTMHAVALATDGILEAPVQTGANCLLHGRWVADCNDAAQGFLLNQLVEDERAVTGSPTAAFVSGVKQRHWKLRADDRVRNRLSRIRQIE